MLWGSRRSRPCPVSRASTVSAGDSEWGTGLIEGPSESRFPVKVKDFERLAGPLG